jgi:hypothetical protein
MDMERMQLIQTPQTTDLRPLSDAEIEAIFASAGLSVEVVAHCNSAGCPMCFSEVAARAA